MRHTRKYREPKKNIDWFILLVGVCFLYFSYNVIGMVLCYNDISRDYNIAKDRLESAKMVNQSLQEERKGLDDVKYIEKIAREELGMTKQGEMPYISTRR